MHLTSEFHWNPDTVHIGEVRSNAFDTNYIACQCKDLGDTEEGDYQYQDLKADESILYSINSILVNLSSNMKRRSCIIATPAASDISTRRKFVSHSRHLKESAELIYDLW